MSNIIKIQNKSNADLRQEEADLVEVTEGILADNRTDISSLCCRSMPIAQLSTLGGGAASLLPALRTVTETRTVDAQGLYRIANAAAGDALKAAKNGNFWAAIKKPGGGSKLAQLKPVEAMTETTKAVMPVNPATMMMAVALYSIEQKLETLEEMEKQIISFLEIEKESEIEADVETLAGIIKKYKFNWDNEHFLASNHKMALDIQRTARKNMLSYQKTVAEMVHSSKLMVVQAQINSTQQEMQKKFMYYRLSLYTYAMACFIEILLSGNFKEENIENIVSEIELQSNTYRELFMKGSAYLEKMTKASVENNVLREIGLASKTVGKYIGNIPVIKRGPVDELLLDGGAQLQKNVLGAEKEVISSFAAISNPGTGVFLEKMRDLIQIYNHTSEIYFDDEKIYLVS